MLLFCCLCDRLTIILVDMFRNMCYIEDNASRNCQTNTVARSVLSRLALWSLVARRRHVKKVGNFHFIAELHAWRKAPRVGGAPWLR